MKLAVFAYSRRGCRTAERAADALPEAIVRRFTLSRFQEPAFEPLPESGASAAFYGALFQEMDALLFVGACGIAVRAIAPHVRDKRTDPAVLCVDERGGFVIPLLSGHIGGANALARRLAASLDAVPVITTATDINARFSVDAWAASQGLALDSMETAKAVSAAILEREVPFFSALPVTGALPNGLCAGENGPLGIYLGYDTWTPFTRTLRLIPPILHVGLGCRRGTTAAAFREAVAAVFRENGLDLRAVAQAASIELKRDEEGMALFCREQGWPLSFYSAETLRALPGRFTPSPFVERVTGVDNVCERAAMVEAERLLVPKATRDGVTVAVALRKIPLSFEEPNREG